MKPGDINIVMSTLSIFEMLLNDACEENQEDYAKFVTSWFQAAISYAVVWGLSGLMNTESRTKFDEFYREVNNNNSNYNFSFIFIHFSSLKVFFYLRCQILKERDESFKIFSLREINVK